MNWCGSRGRRWAASQHLCIFLLMSAAMPALFVSGCRKPAGARNDISIESSMTPQPVRSGMETISIQLTNPSHELVAGAHVQVEGDMSHPGMAPVFADARETSPGNYKATLDFTMGGDWVVLFHITLSDGSKVERQMDVNGVESN